MRRLYTSVSVFCRHTYIHSAFSIQHTLPYIYTQVLQSFQCSTTTSMHARTSIIITLRFALSKQLICISTQPTSGPHNAILTTALLQSGDADLSIALHIYLGKYPRIWFRTVMAICLSIQFVVSRHVFTHRFVMDIWTGYAILIPDVFNLRFARFRYLFKSTTAAFTNRFCIYVHYYPPGLIFPALRPARRALRTWQQ